MNIAQEFVENSPYNYQNKFILTARIDPQNPLKMSIILHFLNKNNTCEKLDKLMEGLVRFLNSITLEGTWTAHCKYKTSAASWQKFLSLLKNTSLEERFGPSADNDYHEERCSFYCFRNSEKRDFLISYEQGNQYKGDVGFYFTLSPESLAKIREDYASEPNEDYHLPDSYILWCYALRMLSLAMVIEGLEDFIKAGPPNKVARLLNADYLTLKPLDKKTLSNGEQVVQRVKQMLTELNYINSNFPFDLFPAIRSWARRDMAHYLNSIVNNGSLLITSLETLTQSQEIEVLKQENKKMVDELRRLHLALSYSFTISLQVIPEQEAILLAFGNTFRLFREVAHEVSKAIFIAGNQIKKLSQELNSLQVDIVNMNEEVYQKVQHSMIPPITKILTTHLEKGAKVANLITLTEITASFLAHGVGNLNITGAPDFLIDLLVLLKDINEESDLTAEKSEQILSLITQAKQAPKVHVEYMLANNLPALQELYNVLSNTSLSSIGIEEVKLLKVLIPKYFDELQEDNIDDLHSSEFEKLRNLDPNKIITEGTLSEINSYLEQCDPLANKERLHAFILPLFHFYQALKDYDQETLADEKKQELLSFLAQASANPKQTLIYCQPGLPYPAEKWPETRTMQDYEKLHKEQYRNYQPQVYDFTKAPSNEIFIEIGPGQGFFAKDLKEKRPDLQLYAVSATPIADQNINYFKEVFYAKWPRGHISSFINRIRRKVGRVYDTFAATTYDHAVETLILIALSLKAGGSCSVIFSGNQDIPGGSSSGFDKHLQRVELFFEKHFNINLRFIRTEIPSKVRPGQMSQDVIAQFTVPANAQPIQGTPEEWYDLANKEIGVRRTLDLKSFGIFKNFTIDVNVFDSNQEENKQTSSEFISEARTVSGLVSYYLHQQYTIGLEPRLIMVFKDAESAQSFAASFARRFLNLARPSWKLSTCKEANMIAIHFYHHKTSFQFIRERYGLAPANTESLSRNAVFEAWRTQRQPNSRRDQAWHQAWQSAVTQLLEHYDIPQLEQSVLTAPVIEQDASSKMIECAPHMLTQLQQDIIEQYFEFIPDETDPDMYVDMLRLKGIC